MSMTKEAVSKPAVVTPAGRLKGKVALITGGSRGIGLSVAKAYVREGARVVIAARTGDELKTALGILKDLGGDATGIRIDLDSAESCRSLYMGAVRSYGRIDVLVNNAGRLGPIAPIVNYPDDEWQAVMRTNTDCVYWLSKAVLSTMIPQNGGSIINVVSSVGEKGRARWGAYSVSKAAVINLTEVIAEEVGQYGIRANAINPGATRTMMRAEAFPGENPETLPSPDEIVNPFIYLASDASRGASGLTLEARDWMGRTF